MSEEPTTPDDEVVALVGLREDPLSVDEVLQAVAHPAGGGIAVFVGVVRDQDHDRGVIRLDYSAHPTAADTLTRVCRTVAARSDALRLAAVHRVGALRVGDVAVVVAVTARHRGQAFTACRDLIDTLKADVPIWKHQLFTDGVSEWVGMP